MGRVFFFKVLFVISLNKNMKYSEEQKRQILDRIYELMEDGKQVRQIFREHRDELKINRSTFKDWVTENDDEAARYARARENMFDDMCDEIIEIADDSTGDEITNEFGASKLDSEFVRRSEVRIKTRQWILEHCDKRFIPKTKQDLTTNEKEISMPVVTLKIVDE